MNNLLAMLPIEQGVFVFLLGLLIVFFGITIIVVVISIIGSIMKRLKDKPAKQKSAEAPAAALVAEGEEDESVRAAIIAAVMAYYMAQGNACKFKIKKIKRI